MKSLTKIMLVFVFAAVLVFSGIGFTNYNKDNEDSTAASSLNAGPDADYSEAETWSYYIDKDRSYSEGDGLSAATAYKISSADDLALMAYRVNMGFDSAYSYYELTQSIDLSAHYWMPIGNYSVYESDTYLSYRIFDGYFNGNGKTIYGMYIGNPDHPDYNSAELEYAGLFGYANGRIENLNLEGFIQNIGSCIGGIVGFSEYLTLDKCTVISGSKINSTLNGDSQIGGLVGENNNEIFFNHCFNYANISTTNGTSMQCRIGGLIACSNIIIIESSGNYGNIISSSGLATGGLAGYTSDAIITSCFNEGNLDVTSTTSSYGDVGGLIAWPSSNLEMTNCYNTGNIYIQDFPSGASGYGGLAGWGGSGTIFNCFTAGDIIINNTEYYVGIIYGNGNYDLIDCYYNGNAILRYNCADVDDPNSGDELSEICGNHNGYSALDFSTLTMEKFLELLNKNGEEWIIGKNGLPTLDIEGKIEKNAALIFDCNYLGAKPDRKTVEKAVNEYILSSDIDELNLERTGYNFIEWADDSGSVYKFKFGFLVDENDNQIKIGDLKGKTLYAQWELIEYTLKIENNGNEYNFSMSNKNITISADDIDAGFYEWEVCNKNGEWSSARELSSTFNISEVLEFLITHAYEDNGTMKIKIRANFADEYTAIYKLTLKSNQELFGLVKFNGEEMINNKVYYSKERMIISLSAEAKKYYTFVTYDISGSEMDNLTNPENSFMITKDTIIYVTFKRIEYEISISSQYSDGSIIDNTALNLVNVSNNNLRIGDIIQITYRTNVSGYKFSILNYEDGVLLDKTGSGVVRLKIDEKVLEHLNGEGKLKLVVIYFKQYSFFIKFDDLSMNDYCIISINNGIPKLNGEGYSSLSRINLGYRYYIDGETDVIIKLTLNEGYRVISFIGLSDLEMEALQSGELILTDISSNYDISINIAPIEYNISLNAKWIAGNKLIDEINFSTGKSIKLEYNGKTDSIERIDIEGYRFECWLIYNWDAKQWTAINPNYVNNGNLSQLDYVDLKTSGYISDSGNIEIIASYIPIYTLTITTAGQWPYKVEIKENGSQNFEEKVNFSSGQFDYGTQVKITVKYSKYIDFSGFKLNGALQEIPENNGYYILERNLTSIGYNVYFDFKSIEQSFNIVKNLNGANGELTITPSEVVTGNELKVKMNDNINFMFDIQSGQKLDKWIINNLTITEMIENNYATFSSNILSLTLDSETLEWLERSGGINITIKTIFNPLFTAAIISGSVLILALLTFIVLYLIAANKKKKKIQAAVESGIIGAARFKTNFHEHID